MQENITKEKETTALYIMCVCNAVTSGMVFMSVWCSSVKAHYVILRKV